MAVKLGKNEDDWSIKGSVKNDLLSTYIYASLGFEATQSV